MLEVFGKAIISFVEKEIVEATPEIEEVLLEHLESLVNTLSKFIESKTAPSEVEHE